MVYTRLKERIWCPSENILHSEWSRNRRNCHLLLHLTFKRSNRCKMFGNTVRSIKAIVSNGNEISLEKNSTTLTSSVLAIGLTRLPHLCFCTKAIISTGFCVVCRIECPGRESRTVLHNVMTITTTSSSSAVYVTMSVTYPMPCAENLPAPLPRPRPPNPVRKSCWKINKVSSA